MSRLKVTMTKTRFVEVGAWRTLEAFWGGKGSAVFRRPARAQIKIRYGNGWWFGKDGQQQSLDGLQAKALRVGSESVFYARMQMMVPRSVEVTYEFYRGSHGERVLL